MPIWLSPAAQNDGTAASYFTGKPTLSKLPWPGSLPVLRFAEHQYIRARVRFSHRQTPKDQP
jgi:hypothetical protein